MRFALALLIWLVFFGGLALYMQHREAPGLSSKPDVQIEAAAGHYALEITTTFTVEPDPFALQIDNGGRKPALLVRLADREILRVTDQLRGGTPIRVEPLLELSRGINEIYLEASAPLEQSGISHAVRVQILSDGQTVAEQTFWSLPGGKVSDTMRFELIPSHETESNHGN